MTPGSMIDGINNFRSLEGTPVARGRRVKPGVLYRSEALVGLSDKAKSDVEALRIRCVCDLRSANEQKKHPLVWPGEQPKLLEVEVLPDARVAGADLIRGLLTDRSGEAVRQLLVANAKDMPQAFAKSMRSLFEAVIDERALPLLVGCTAGKDRTGYVIAVILLALGASEETIVEDFVRTAHYIDKDWLYDALAAWVPDLPEETLSPERLHELSHLPEYVLTSLHVIRQEHGSYERFFEDVCGLDASRRERLRDLMTEPAGALTAG